MTATTVAEHPQAARRWLDAAIGGAALRAATLGAAALGAATIGPAAGSGRIRLRVRGAIRRSEAQWLDWEGRQGFDASGLGFRWQARIRVARFVWVDAEDRLDAEGGYGGARVMGIVPVGSARGPEVTRSQLVRNLAELAFVPSVALRAVGLGWTADGDDAFILSAPGIDPGAVVRAVVDGAGDVRQARSPDRPREDGRGGFLHDPYRLDFEGHETLASGIRIPRLATGTFETAGGEWPYWRYEVLEVA